MAQDGPDLHGAEERWSRMSMLCLDVHLEALHLTLHRLASLHELTLVLDVAAAYPAH